MILAAQSSWLNTLGYILHFEEELLEVLVEFEKVLEALVAALAIPTSPKLQLKPILVSTPRILSKQLRPVVRTQKVAADRPISPFSFKNITCTQNIKITSLAFPQHDFESRVR